MDKRTMREAAQLFGAQGGRKAAKQMTKAQRVARAKKAARVAAIARSKKAKAKRQVAKKGGK